MAKKKQYVVVGESLRWKNSFAYINTDTKSLRGIWTTMRNFELSESYNDPTPPKVFEGKAEAVLYKKQATRDEKQSYQMFPVEWTVMEKSVYERNYAPVELAVN